MFNVDPCPRCLVNGVLCAAVNSLSSIQANSSKVAGESWAVSDMEELKTDSEAPSVASVCDRDVVDLTMEEIDDGDDNDETAAACHLSLLHYHRMEHVRGSVLQGRQTSFEVAAYDDEDEEKKGEVDVVGARCDGDDDDNHGCCEMQLKEERDSGARGGADLSFDKRLLLANGDERAEDGATASQPLCVCSCCETVLTRRSTFVPPCGHCYCAMCLGILTRISFGANVPPRCCESAIPMELLQAALSPCEYALLLEEVGE